MAISYKGVPQSCDSCAGTLDPKQIVNTECYINGKPSNALETALSIQDIIKTQYKVIRECLRSIPNYSVEGAAKSLGVSKSRVRRMVRDGLLQGIYDGHELHIPLDSVREIKLWRNANPKTWHKSGQYSYRHYLETKED